MLYLLPTRGKAGYRGKRPNAIRSFSGGTKSLDRDGNRCVHWETNSGERYTCTLDRLEDLQSYNGYMGKVFTDLVKSGTPIVTMTQEEYDAWLAAVRAERLAAKEGRS